MNVVMLGPPGAGKGTQAQRLSRVLNVPVIASGDIFREIRQEDTPLAAQVRSIMDRGEYVPDELTIEIVLQRLAEPDARDGFILDGFPRTQGQAQALDKSLEDKGQRVDAALYITAPTAVLEARLGGRVVCPQCHAVYNLVTNPPKNDMICDVCGHKVERRSDEAPEVIRRRLTAFSEQTKPIIDYYRKKGVLWQIDGSKPFADVEAEVDRALGAGEPT